MKESEIRQLCEIFKYTNVRILIYGLLNYFNQSRNGFQH